MAPSASVRDALALAGRALIALLFVLNGIEQVLHFAGTVGYIKSEQVPLPEVAAAISIAVHLGFGLLLLAGWQARWAALGLALFTLAITPIFHHYWSLPPSQAAMQEIMFYKNLAIVGGLLGVVAWGPGGWSLDGRPR